MPMGVGQAIPGSVTTTDVAAVVDAWWATAPRTVRSPRSSAMGWFHRYPARFGPGVAEALMRGASDRLGRVPRLVVDSYAGSGTTLALARRVGVPSVGVDISPLAQLMMQVRFAPPRDISRLVDLVETFVAQDWPTRPIPDELARWVGEPNAIGVGAFLELIESVEDEASRAFLRLVLSSALRASSFWLAGSIKPQWDPQRTPTPLALSARRVVRALARDCRVEAARAATPVVFMLGDAAHLPVPDHAADALLTSPPYFVSYDYMDVHRLSFLAFGWELRVNEQLGRRTRIEVDGVEFKPPETLRQTYYDTFRGERTFLGRALRAYVQGLRKHLREVERIVAPRGVVAFAVADSIRAGERFPLAAAAAELLEEAGFDEVTARRRTTSHHRILPAGRDRQSGRFATDAERQVDERIIWARGQR